MEQAITAEQAERIASALERIAAALETISYKTPAPNPAPWTQPSPYTTPAPRTIPLGPYTPYPYTTGDFPNSGITMSGGTMKQCGAFGDGGSCWLGDGHSGEHQFARIANG